MASHDTCAYAWLNKPGSGSRLLLHNVHVYVPYSRYFSNQIKFQAAMLCTKIKRPRIISVPKLFLNEKSVTELSSRE